MKRNIIETVLGAIVLLVAAAFLIYSSSSTEAGTVKGYDVSVSFNEVGGLKSGDDVRVGGVKIGSVKSISLDPATYRAKVTMSIEDDVKLPSDTAARVSSESLMGGNYMALDVGGDEENIRPGGTIQYSQDAQNLESLLGKFIFSMNDKGGEKTAEKTAAKTPEKPATPAPAKTQPVTPDSTTITPVPSDESTGSAPLPQM